MFVSCRLPFFTDKKLDLVPGGTRASIFRQKVFGMNGPFDKTFF